MAKSKNKFKICFDSPVILVLVFILIVMAIIERSLPELARFCTCPISIKSVSDFFRILLYPFGFGSWNLLASNLVFILLLGTKVEDVFGRLITSIMILLTVLVGGVFCVCFSSSIIYGTSGIVCMFLILSIYVSIDKRQIPFSFVLLAVIYFAREVVFIIDGNSLEIFCHFCGALAGSLVGVLSLTKGKK